MTSGRVAGRAPAKVNLYLRLTGRRANGYHELDSLVVFVDIADELYIDRSVDLSLTTEGPFAPSLQDTDSGENLVMRAARLLKTSHVIDQGAAMHLVKSLPVAAGIGGGSADGALALRLLCQFWDLDLPAENLETLAMSLGADVPVCLAGRPARMRGIGERVDPVVIPNGAWMVLANPGRALVTAKVFAAFDGVFSGPTRLEDWSDVPSWAEALRPMGNDLERAARRLVPEIGPLCEYLAAQNGCLLARMSGSGATCFGLFSDADAARRAADALNAQSGIWARAGAVLGSEAHV